MKELLDRLKQVDPATYEKISRGIPILPRSTYYVFDVDSGKPRAEMHKHGWIPFANLPLEVACAWLQAVLQDAIAAKGHMLSVSHTWPKESLPAYQWKARIFIDPDNIVESRGDSPAEALLAAYVEACGRA